MWFLKNFYHKKNFVLNMYIHISRIQICTQNSKIMINKRHTKLLLNHFSQIQFHPSPISSTRGNFIPCTKFHSLWAISFIVTDETIFDFGLVAPTLNLKTLKHSNFFNKCPNYMKFVAMNS